MKCLQILCALASILFSGNLVFAQKSLPSETQVLKAAQASFAEYFELLALPNDAIVPADIQKNTDWLQQAFMRRGFNTQQLPNAGKPPATAAPALV